MFYMAAKTKSVLRIAATILAVSSTGLSGIAASEGRRGPDGKRQAELQQILIENCTICHGPELKGKVGPALTPKALASKNEQALVNTILEGRPGTAMPAWAFMLNESEALWLANYLRKGHK